MTTEPEDPWNVPLQSAGIDMYKLDRLHGEPDLGNSRRAHEEQLRGIVGSTLTFAGVEQHFRTIFSASVASMQASHQFRVEQISPEEKLGIVTNAYQLILGAPVQAGGDGLQRFMAAVRASARHHC